MSSKPLVYAVVDGLKVKFRSRDERYRTKGELDPKCISFPLTEYHRRIIEVDAISCFSAPPGRLPEPKIVVLEVIRGGLGKEEKIAG
jgi:hypothetical protein